MLRSLLPLHEAVYQARCPHGARHTLHRLLYEAPHVQVERVSDAFALLEALLQENCIYTEVRSWILAETKSAVVDFLHRNADTAKALEAKIEANEKLRTELNSVKKEAREAARKISLKIPKLKDCKYHVEDGEKGENSMIFITEGDSATGAMVGCRDANTQALFSGQEV